MPYPNLTEFEVGFLVGLFEGEGSIIISKTKRKYTRGRNGKKYPSSRSYIMNHITITNSNLELLQYTQGLIQGKIRDHMMGNKNHKRTYILSLTKQEEILWFLNKLFPYLIEKKNKAKLMIDWCEARIENGKKKKKYFNSDLLIFNKFEEIRRESVSV